MKRYIKSIITLTALLFLGTGAASAQSSSQEEEEKAVKATKVIQLDGKASTETAAGKLEITLSEPDDKMEITMTIKATPANGNYITEDFIYLTKTVDGNMAQTRDPNIDTEKIEVTSSEGNVNPRETTTYTYKISPAEERVASSRGVYIDKDYTRYYYYDYEVNANFQSLKDISKAVVTVSGTYVETGEDLEIEAGNVTVTLDGETVDPKYYTYECKDTEKAGDATITVTGIGIYTGTATGTFKINEKEKDGYPLWVNGIQVTESNCQDVLGHKDNPEEPLYIFNYDEEKNLKQLLIDHDQTGTTVIESRMDDLKIYLMDVSKIDHIFFNNDGDTSNKGTLTFTTNGNFPGKLVLTNSTKGESAIKGFSEINYNWNLVALEPDGVDYNTTKLQMEYKEKDEDGKETGNILVADNITIGQAIVPITEKKTIRFEETQLVEKDENGEPLRDEYGNFIPADLANYSYAPSNTEKNVVLINLNPANIDDTNAGGFDVENGISGIYIVDTMTDDDAGTIARDVVAQKMVPGGSTYADSYDGFTFIVPAGEGTVEIDEIVEDDYEFHLIIGTKSPITLDERNSTVRRYDAKSQRVQAELYFNVTEPTYCYLYMVKKGAGTRGIGGTRLGKREKAHGKLISLSVSVTRSIPTDPPSEASGGALDEDEDPEVETGITNVRYEQAVGGDRWYNLKGQQIERPTQKGIYIQNRKKIIIK